MPATFHFPAGRVALRQLRPTDLPTFAAYRADPAVARFQSWEPYPEAQAAAFLAQMADAPVPAPPGGWVQIAIAHAEDDLLLGDFGLHIHDHAPDTAEFGITLASRWQGQGYASAAVCGLLRYCFAELGLRRVVANTDVRNLGCIRLLESVGMRREGHFMESGWYKGELCSEYQYALLARER